MPKYTYFCSECKCSYALSHRLSEIHDVCRSCGSQKTLNKIPTSFAYSKMPDKNPQTGDLVKEFIEDSKGDIKEAKQELQGRKYED
jgi:hypothetical protein